jgi:hypothetical protein
MGDFALVYASTPRLGRAAIKPLAAIAAATTLLGIASPSAKADTYDLTAEILYFRSWIDPGNSLQATANSTVLTNSSFDGGAYQGAVYNWSNQVWVGGSSVTFAYDPAIIPNRRVNSFDVSAGSPVTVVPGQTFDLATVTFTNGSWFYKADVSVQFVATDRTTGKNNVFYADFVITSVASTPVGADSSGLPVFEPYAEADYFTLAGYPAFGSVRVFETIAQPPGNPGNVGSVQFTAKIGSLDPVGFASPTGGAFLDSSIDPGLADPHANVPAAPEPSTWAMLLIGFAGLSFARYRKSRAAAGLVG